MNIKDFFFQKKEPQTTIVEPQPLMSTFSTPFGKIGEGNLSLPYIRTYKSSEPFVRFGADNLYPMILTQLYYSSPLHSGIINFKTNSVIGGGYELMNNNSTAKAKVDEYAFLMTNKFDKLTRLLTKDLIMHGRVYIKMCYINKKIHYKRISPEKVRCNQNKTMFTINDDWTNGNTMYTLTAYRPDFQDECLYSYEMDSPGMDVYPLPTYTSSLNWIYLDGEISYLQKSNIINSIFPSFMLTMANKFKSAEEAENFKKVIEKSKGAPNAGRIMTFVSEFPDNLPTVTPIPGNANDKIFDSTITNLENNICRAHEINPQIMGILTPGKLGSGAELPQAYAIYEKNVVMPLREELTDLLNDLLFIGGVTSTLKIKDYQIVDQEIMQTNPKY